jgi:hypothetical protein
MAIAAIESLAEFGLPVRLPRRVAEQLVHELSELWQAAHQRSPGALRPDLAAHHSYFDPVAQGQRLRDAMTAIEPVALSDELLAPVMRLEIDGERWLITPEGRIALALLQKALEQPGAEVEPDTDLAEHYERELLGLYREWGRHRQRQVIDLMGGGKNPLQIPAIGAALTLLVNRSDSPERAIRRFPKEQRAARRTVDEAFFACAQAFADTINPPRSGGTRNTKQKEELISGWTLGEVRRRLPKALVLDRDAGLVYVAPGQQEALMDLLVAELLRRRKVSVGVFEEAFDALVAAFHNQAEALAGYGLLFERASNTAQLREQLLERWRQGD